MSKDKFVTMARDGRIEVPRNGRSGYHWASGWKLVYRDGRETMALRYREAFSMLKVENAKPVEVISFTRVNSDVNGNPRYVCHFLNLLTREEVDRVQDVTQKYAIAIQRANQIGGRKFNNKQYGGGIVFSSYSLRAEARAISRLTGRIQIAEKD